MTHIRAALQNNLYITEKESIARTERREELAWVGSHCVLLCRLPAHTLAAMIISHIFLRTQLNIKMNVWEMHTMGSRQQREQLCS